MEVVKLLMRFMIKIFCTCRFAFGTELALII